MNLDQMVADAKERCHRSIGQRARWALHDFYLNLAVHRQTTEFLYALDRYEEEVTGR